MTNCTFCEIAAGRIAPEAMVYENDAVVAFFDRAAVAEHHTLVVPRAHARDIFAVSEEDLCAVTSAIRHICGLYRGKLGI